MNQQEVIELMQRHLDHDLNDKELNLLLEHLDQDPESREMFERMKLLSENLANLPRVSPPQSIVDSIMPELDRLEQEKTISLQPTKKHTTQKRFWTYASGIMAAAVVLGLFVFYGELPGQRPDAGEITMDNNMTLEDAALFQAEESADQGQERMMISPSFSASSIDQESVEQDVVTKMGSASVGTKTTSGEHEFFYDEPEKESFVAPDEPHYFPPLSSPDSEKVVYLRLKEDGWHLSIENEQEEELAMQGPIYADQMLEWSWSDESDQVSAKFISGEQEFWIHLELP